MAYLIMPKGEPDICEGPCQHTDCAYWRELIGRPCSICGEPVAAGHRFNFLTKATFPAASDETVAHAACVWARADARRAEGR